MVLPPPGHRRCRAPRAGVDDPAARKGFDGRRRAPLLPAAWSGSRRPGGGSSAFLQTRSRIHSSPILSWAMKLSGASRTLSRSSSMASCTSRFTQSAIPRSTRSPATSGCAATASRSWANSSTRSACSSTCGSANILSSSPRALSGTGTRADEGTEGASASVSCCCSMCMRAPLGLVGRAMGGRDGEPLLALAIPSALHAAAASTGSGRKTNSG